MSRERLAAAYEELAALHAKVADQYAQVAHELSAPIEPAVARTAVAEPAPAAAAGSSPGPAATHCPKHGGAFKPSKNPEWPAYCTSQSDDPAWSNAKGYCRINSKNAAEWRSVHGLAA